MSILVPLEALGPKMAAAMRDFLTPVPCPLCDGWLDDAGSCPNGHDLDDLSDAELADRIAREGDHI